MSPQQENYSVPPEIDATPACFAPSPGESLIHGTISVAISTALSCRGTSAAPAPRLRKTYVCRKHCGRRRKGSEL